MEKRKKTRLDVLLVDRGLAETREKAKRSVMAGLVYSGTERLDKAGDKVFDDIRSMTTTRSSLRSFHANWL